MDAPIREKMLRFQMSVPAEEQVRIVVFNLFEIFLMDRRVDFERISSFPCLIILGNAS